MSEITWVLVLGAIAIIFPIMVINVVETLGYEEEEFFIDNFMKQEVYNQISEMNCDNFDDEAWELLYTHSYMLDTDFKGVPVKTTFDIICVFDNNHVSKWIERRLLPYDEVIFENQEEETNRLTRGIIRGMGLERFFSAMNTLPSSVSNFIYIFYSLLIAFLIYKGLTLA